MRTGPACVYAGKLRKALPHSGTPWPLGDLQPLPPTAALDGGRLWRASSWPGSQVRRRNSSRSPLSAIVVVTTHLFFCGRTHLLLSSCVCLSSFR